MKRISYKTWSFVLFGLFIALFMLMALFKNETTTWIWQLCLPILLVAQVFVVLRSKEKSRKNFDDEWYERK